MKLFSLSSSAVVAWVSVVTAAPCVTAFAPSSPNRRDSFLQLHRQQPTNDDSNDPVVSSTSKTTVVLLSSWDRVARQTLATVAMAATLWATPAFLASSNQENSMLASLPMVTHSTAMAKEMASGSGSRVNKDPESLLRYGLPINNKEARKLQVALEEVKLNIGSKRKAAAESAVRTANTILSSTAADKMKADCRDAKLCESYFASMQQDLGPLSNALKDSMDSFTGSEQERSALDKAYAAQRKVVGTLSKLEEQMIPAGYKTPVPEIYNDFVQLQGRATVEMVLEKADKSNYDVNGQSYPKAKMTMVIDGYAAPITGGNFIDLVQKGFYNKMPIQRSDGFVVQTGDPDGEATGYVGKGSKSVGNGPHGERLIPLEIFVKGDKGPTYESTIEDEGRGGQASVLPFSSYGAMGWAREEYDANSGSSQFFWLLFDSDLTPAGKNVLDGTYPCFGYVTEGAEFLEDMDEGDIILSAKVTEGAENLVQP